jgi:hypothetical protein
VVTHVNLINKFCDFDNFDNSIILPIFILQIQLVISHFKLINKFYNSIVLLTFILQIQISRFHVLINFVIEVDNLIIYFMSSVSDLMF